MKVILLITIGLFWASPIFSQTNSCEPKDGPQEGPQGGGGDSARPPYTPYGPPAPSTPFDIPVTRPSDPNELTGSPGFAAGHWISLKDKLQYTVHFENDPKFATAPATNVYLTIPVHPGINPAALKLGPFGFGPYLFQPPLNSSAYSARLDLRDSLGIYLDVIAGIDVIRNEVFWTFKSIDPATGLQPADPMRGFLPVNDTSAAADTAQGPGQGFVSFVLGPKSSLVTSDTVTARAGIVFDANAAIPTNVWLNTIDAFAPSSSVQNATASLDTITLHYSGVDDAGGTGVRSYAIYYSENGGPFLLYKKDLTETVATFTGIMGNTYGFFSLSTDNVGNVEALKTGAERTISLTSPGIPLPITWLYFEGRRQFDDVMLTWAVSAERDCKSYVVERSLDGRRFTEIGTVAAGNTPGTANYSYPDDGAAKLNAERLFYRIRQISTSNASVYSKTVVIPLRHDESPGSVTAYPNPFSNIITLQILNVARTDKDDIVQIYSLDGRLRYQKPLVLNGASTVLLDDLPLLEPGTYLLKAVIGKQLFTIKMTRK